MYLSSSSIEKLVRFNGEGLAFDKLYSSADAKESKREGSLYETVFDDLGISRDKFVHCGDSYHSDFIMANRFGISAIYTPRSTIWELRNKLSHYIMLKKMGIA
jgi:predicted HAD superfamily hydrolase